MGNTPSIGRVLWRAADQGNAEKVDEIGKWIHSHYMTRFEIADILEWTDRRGLTPLMIAILRRHSCIVRMLLEMGADVNSQNNKDKVNSALHYAAKVDSVVIIDLLLQRNANPLALNSLGLTPKDVALLRRNWKSFTLLCDAVKFFDGMLHYQVTAQQRPEYLWGNPPGSWRSRRVLLLETEDPNMVEMVLIRENLPSLLVFVSKEMGVKHSSTSAGSHIINFWGSKQKITYNAKKFHRCCLEENLAQLGFVCPSPQLFEALYDALTTVGFEVESSPSYQHQSPWAEAVVLAEEEEPTEELTEGELPAAHAVMEEPIRRRISLFSSTLSLPCPETFDPSMRLGLSQSTLGLAPDAPNWNYGAAVIATPASYLAQEPSTNISHQVSASLLDPRRYMRRRVHARTYCGGGSEAEACPTDLRAL